MSIFDALNQAAKATVRAAVTPVVVIKDAGNILNFDDLETPNHVKKVVKDVLDIPDKIDE